MATELNTQYSYLSTFNRIIQCYFFFLFYILQNFCFWTLYPLFRKWNPPIWGSVDYPTLLLVSMFLQQESFPTPPPPLLLFLNVPILLQHPAPDATVVVISVFRMFIEFIFPHFLLACVSPMVTDLICPVYFWWPHHFMVYILWFLWTINWRFASICHSIGTAALSLLPLPTIADGMRHSLACSFLLSVSF